MAWVNSWSRDLPLAGHRPFGEAMAERCALKQANMVWPGTPVAFPNPPKHPPQRAARACTTIITTSCIVLEIHACLIEIGFFFFEVIVVYVGLWLWTLCSFASWHVTPALVK